MMQSCLSVNSGNVVTIALRVVVVVVVVAAAAVVACVVGGDKGGVAWYWCSCSTSGSEMYSGLAMLVLLAEEFFLREVVVSARLNVCILLMVLVLAEMLFDLDRFSLTILWVCSRERAGAC